VPIPQGPPPASLADGSMAWLCRRCATTAAAVGRRAMSLLMHASISCAMSAGHCSGHLRSAGGHRWRANPEVVARVPPRPACRDLQTTGVTFACMRHEQQAGAQPGRRAGRQARQGSMQASRHLPRVYRLPAAPGPLPSHNLQQQPAQGKDVCEQAGKQACAAADMQ
jgi:hypothetical protein